MCLSITNELQDRYCYFNIRTNYKSNYKTFLFGMKDFRILIQDYENRKVKLLPYYYSEYQYILKPSIFGIEVLSKINDQKIILKPKIKIITDKEHEVKLADKTVKYDLGMHVSPLYIKSKDEMLCTPMPMDATLIPPFSNKSYLFNPGIKYPLYSVPVLFLMDDVQMVDSNNVACVKKLIIPYSKYIKDYIIYKRKKNKKDNKWYIKIQMFDYVIRAKCNKAIKEKLNKRDYLKSIDRLISMLKLQK